MLLILAAVSIQMLTGDNGIITNASKVSTSNAYKSAEEQVKLAYMAVKAEISAKTVKSGTYDPTVASETTALATIVENDLGANKLNMKAVSSMLDTDLWKTYMDTSGKAQYAIGGPTIEMLLKSYNDTHGTDFGAKTTSDNGYKITKTATSNTGWTNSIASMLKTSSTEASNMPTSIKTLYVSETGQTNSNAYWLSSPADSDSNSLMDMDCSGGIFNPYYSINYIGFRPIVCLKSNVQLVEASGAKKAQGIDFELR